ncbi:MAG: hypothetical protein AB7O96_05880 [Pseudobdellovibrionaceae bacterium]
MIRILILVVFFFTSLASAEKSRPMDEMHSDCSAYSVPLKSEFELWKKQSRSLQQEDKTAQASIGEKLNLKLVKQTDLQLPSPPEKSFAKGDLRFAGFFPLSIKEPGDYRVSIGSKVWLDIVSAKTKKTIEATSFEMQTKCDSIFKTVLFKLDKNEEYFVQISSSKNPEVDLVITKP